QARSLVAGCDAAHVSRAEQLYPAGDKPALEIASQRFGPCGTVLELLPRARVLLNDEEGGAYDTGTDTFAGCCGTGGPAQLDRRSRGRPSDSCLAQFRQFVLQRRP